MIREPGDTKVHHMSDADIIESIGDDIHALVTERVRDTYPKFARFGPQWIKVYDEAVSNMRRAARQMYDLKRVMVLHEQDVLDREDLPMRAETLSE